MNGIADTETVGSGVPSKGGPITAECFAPPQIPFPRPWQRVSVSPVPGQRRQRRIWKRVGGLPTVPVNDPLARAMAELERQGQGPRKRGRLRNHFPTWGDARWDPRVEQVHDGKPDLVEAQAAVSAVQDDETAAASRRDATTKPATFPQERLKWVPRKRHNSRWPVEPKAEEATTQPLIKFEAPTSPELVDAMVQIDEKQMKRRSTRRLSRRFSLFPGDDSPRKLAMVTLLPAKCSAPAPSPVKKPPLPQSPARVADSPLRSFRVNATPTKVILESPKADPPAKSPSKPSSSAEDATVTSVVKILEPKCLPHQTASPVPLIFDQPVPEQQIEPQHEARRRVSLQHARRSDRGSSGVSRLLALKSGRNSPNRRHSFASMWNAPTGTRSEAKGRRNTMDVLCVGPDEIRGAVACCRDDVDAGFAHSRKSEEVVEIDMRTNLDIFGQPLTGIEHIRRQRSPGQDQNSEGAKPISRLESPPLSANPAASPAEDDSGSAADILSLSSTESPCVAEATKVEIAAQNTSFFQAAASPNPEDHIFLEPTSQALEEFTNFEEGRQPETRVTLHELEGLSTIYEEPSISEEQSPEQSSVERADHELTPAIGVQPFANEKSTAEDEQANTPATPARGISTYTTSSLELNPEALVPAINPARLVTDKQAATELVLERSPLSVSGSHVVSSAAALSSPDSPQHGRQMYSVGISHQPPFETQTEDGGSPGTFGGSILAPPTKEGLGPNIYECPAIPAQQSHGMVPSDPSVSPGSPSWTVNLVPSLPATPATGIVSEATESVVTPEPSAAVVTDTMQQERSGFTPINGRQISPLRALPGLIRDEKEAGDDHEPHELDADEIIEEEIPDGTGDEADAALEDDTLTVDPPRPENDTLQLQALHEDSETEMLRRFVTRVAADKNAKAAAEAAAALVKKTARRSGSIGSITSSTGSPMARSEEQTPGNRKPLGERSPNSLSPEKKRKLEMVQDDLSKAKDSSQCPADDPGDEPRLKRRRKLVDPALDNPIERATPSPEPDFPDSSVPGPRRSARARSTRVALRPAAPSANSIAFSMIPVRLPGMGAMDDAAMEAHLAAMARQRCAEKDLAAVTRANTRKNKSGALPPQVVLAKQAEDPSWRMRELKGVFEAKERRKDASSGWQEQQGGEEWRKVKKAAKGVRWAEELVRFQVEAEPSVAAREVLEADMVVADGGVDEIAEAEPPAVSEPTPKSVRVAARKAAPKAETKLEPVSTRRTRSSKLQAPTPIKKMAGGEKEKEKEKTSLTSGPSLRTRARSLPRLAPAPVTTPAPPIAPLPPMAPTTSASVSTSTRSGMATRRTRITKLGMSVNGTPAPKRKGRAAV